MSDHSAFQEHKEPIAYRGTHTHGNLTQTVSLNTRGQLHINTRERKYPTSKAAIPLASILGLVGLATCALVAFGSAHINGQGFPLALAGMAMMGLSFYLLNYFLYATERYTIQSPIDQQTIKTLKRFKGKDPEVTEDLLTIASATRKQTQATASLDVARERIELAGETDAIAGELARAQKESDQASKELEGPMRRLISFAYGEEHSSK